MERDNELLGRWSAALARVVAALGTEDFLPRLDQAIRALVPFDNSMLFAYRGNEQPIGVYTDLATQDEVGIIVGDYVIGPYVLDPFFAEVQGGRISGLAKLSDIAPDRFYDSEYYKRHYARTGILDEIGFFMGAPGGVTAVHSITRRQTREPFKPEEVAILGEIAPVVSALGSNNWGTLYKSFDAKRASDGTDASDTPHPVETALNAIGQDVLSDRQSEVITFILRGHSTESISLHLNISSGTVKIHRKNAYNKLGISSQAELFSLFLDRLRSLVPPVSPIGVSVDPPSV
ncbi:helix-turn-helix transcriptional regulator [Marivibrio halodurans]|uniref:Helix-turn-helix transcriptional regulator n=1 Tax=Marivibrio halodurans TaxID=2039722 RepID=A0A8J7SKV1_9PROT|nr:helix-turn-helix transcriptional regulator [Marivibrio halodurans]MBP5855771.1 helix-turn-helix transcriptional regulator [Marivibrio halodurans]